MPIHDKVEDVDKFLKADIDQSIKAGIMQYKDCWIKPAHWIATACLFPRHFMPHMTPAEALTFMPMLERFQSVGRAR